MSVRLLEAIRDLDLLVITRDGCAPGYARDLLSSIVYVPDEGEDDDWVPVSNTREADTLFRTLVLDDGRHVVDAERVYHAAVRFIASAKTGGE